MGKRPEILAPAGSYEALEAAVYCGANAVYLGSKSLNARRNAGNFDAEELERAVAFCHERDVKVYQTLNILLKEAETGELLQALETACRLGVDGVMVQDLGVLAVMKSACPALPAFASTQMVVHNLAGVLEAAALGCKRVVLARELSAGEIGAIAAASPVELEVFVHGALCMCLSGQCYLSAMLGGRSGNRGLCAQPCRLPFAAGEASHALSLKDLTLAPQIQQLAALGVQSLKIEGRMKRPEYVAAAVTAIKAALEGGAPDLDTLQKVFSRSGFTAGYFENTLSVGMFGTRQREDVVAAEGVLKQLTRLYAHETPLVGLDAALTAQAGMKTSLTLTDAQGRSATAVGEPPQVAHTRASEAEQVQASLSKLGGTPYYYKSVSIDLGEAIMLPAAQINALRREAVEQLREQRRLPSPIPFAPTLPAPLPASEKEPLRVRVRCFAHQITPQMVALCDDLILPYQQLADAIAAGVPAYQLIAELPRVLFDTHVVEEALAQVLALGVDRAWAGNLGAVRLAREAGLSVCGGWSLNCFNAMALGALQEAELSDCELSPELTLTEALAITGMPRGLLAYGHLPLMVFRNCPLRERIGCAACGRDGKLTDRMNVQFRVSCEDGMASLYNTVPTYLADKHNQLAELDFITLWFTHESAATCLSICEQYCQKSAPFEPENGFTRGLSYRGVL